MIDIIWKRRGNLIPENVSTRQSKDTGMALVVICLIVTYFSNDSRLLLLAIFIQIVNMIFPALFRPVAKIWLAFSNLLGTIMSKLLLSIVFFTIVTPIGLFRRVLGYYSLQLNKWKKGKESVFGIRYHDFKPEDIERPY
jgi:hypothetical protein